MLVDVDHPAMSPAQDYKKALNGDKGLNTGGMGTYSPSRVIDAELIDRIQRELLDPFIVGIQKMAWILEVSYLLV